jgi:hypothetical protein
MLCHFAAIGGSHDRTHCGRSHRVTLGGNVFQGSCETDLFASFARHHTGLRIDQKPGPYLLN